MTRPTQAQIVEALDYDPSTGIFRWRHRRSTRVMAGDVAGCKTPDGYIYIKMMKQCIYAHRLAWVYIHGSYPPVKIDHIDGDKTNNRIANLRSATVAENTQNQTHVRDTPSGLIGVCWNKKAKKWQAQIRGAGFSKYLGLHETKESAYEAYCNAKQVFHPTAPNRRIA